MPRYFFHLVSPDHVVRDNDGLELDGLAAAHWRAVKLVHKMHVHLPDAGDDWRIEITDETGGKPLVVLPSSVPMRRLRGYAQPRGLALKVSDEFTVPLCAIHHTENHATGDERRWWEEHKIDPLAVAEGLWKRSRPL